MEFLTEVYFQLLQSHFSCIFDCPKCMFDVNLVNMGLLVWTLVLALGIETHEHFQKTTFLGSWDPKMDISNKNS